MPDRVDQSLRFLRDHGVWHLESRNPPVRSCADAAAHRRRLGHIGIPLCDELKSLLCSYNGVGGERCYVLLHCRGHQLLDLAKASTALNAEILPVGRRELESIFGAEYGTVTPLLLGAHPNARQIVDPTLMVRFFSPYTMMTNCGDLQHAIEFNPAELFGSISDTSVVDIVVDADKRVPNQTLGILTGNLPESGMLLWERINQLIRTDPRVRFRGDAGLPRIVVDSVPGMGESMELPERERDVRQTVLDAVQGLCTAGATTIGVACNTTQYFAREIGETCSRFGARFVSMAEETAAYLRRTKTTQFDLLGIKTVTDLNRSSDFGKAFAGFDVHLPESRQVVAVTELAYRVKYQLVTPASINRLRDLINQLTATDTVVVANTELSFLLSQQTRPPRSGKRFIDTLDILARSMADIYLEERIATGGA